MVTLKAKSEYIAPWALPKENVPVHIVWASETIFDFITVEVPPEIEFQDFYNVDSFQIKKNTLYINKLKTNNYFGFVVSSKNIINNKHEHYPIDIKVYNLNEVIYKKIFIINLYRPFLNIVGKSNSITLVDDMKNMFIEIELELSGFGHIQILTDIEIGGKFFERSDTIYREIIRRVITQFPNEFTDKSKKKILISPIYLERKTKEIIDNIYKRNIPLDVDEKTISDFYNWLENDINKSKISEIITRHIENLLIDSILFYLDKNPVVDVQMPQGIPSLYIEKATEEVRIRFRYKDSLMNEYDPILLTINVKDNRQDKKQPIEIPFKLKWNFKKINPNECEMI